MSRARAEEAHGQAALLLRAAGQRYTAARRAIVAALRAADRPLAIPELRRRARGLAQSSTYRNLVVLEEAGVVACVRADATPRWELAEGILGHHHHLVCARCGEVRDVRMTPALERALDAGLAGLARAAGYALDGHRLDLIGRCRRCR